MKNISTSLINESDEMKLNKITLSFPDEDIEKKFLDDYSINSISYTRFYIILALCLFLPFGYIDYKLGMHQRLIIRYAIICPLIISLFITSFFSFFKKYIQIAIAFMIILCAIGLCVMNMLEPNKNMRVLYVSFILISFFGFTLSGARFIWATVTCIAIALLFFISEYWICNDCNERYLFLSTMYFIGSVILGMLGCYQRERQKRIDFFLRNQLNKLTFELKFLNDMSQSLYKCHTENSTYGILEDTCYKLFPDDSGYVITLNNDRTKLEKVINWNDSFSVSEQIDIDSCIAFNNRGSQFSAKLCDQIPSDQDGLCLHINIGKEQSWGVFHLLFGQATPSDFENPKKNDSKYDLAVRMIDQYSLFLTNLRLRIIDPITELYNRIYIRDSLEEELKVFKYSGIMIIDIDGFKDFKEKYGNDVADSLLWNFTDFLKKNMRKHDIICKNGDSEFLLAIPRLSISETGKQAEQIRSQIEEQFFKFYNEEYKITASFGVVEFPLHGSNINALLKNISKAVRRAKDGGGNRVVVL